MPQSLVSLWHNNTAYFAEKSCSQVLGLAGDGRLRDNSEASTEFRKLLSVLPHERLRSYADECLTEKFGDAPYALQDTVNEIGARLGFKVEPGRYRGTPNHVGFDAVWRSANAHALLVEVKTTDAYRINLDTVASYRAALVEATRIGESTSSILLAVGRQDTGDLEAQIRGSRHAWDIRVISIDALIRLMEIKQQMSDWSTSSRINLLLQPMEYTRVDEIINLLFATTTDIQTPDDELVDGESNNEDKTNTKRILAPFDHEHARSSALRRLEELLGTSLKRVGRVFWSSADRQHNVVCLSSRPHDRDATTKRFWYGVKPGHRPFLDDVNKGYIVFACGSDFAPVAIPAVDFLPMLSLMQTTPARPTADDPIVHWHVTIHRSEQRAEISTPVSGGKLDITQFVLK